VGQRLYFACPYSTETTATDARSIFVFDPAIGNGAWMLYRGSDGFGLGPFAQSGFGGGSSLTMGCSRSQADIMKIDFNTLPIDNFAGVNAGFPAYYTTPWVDADFPTLKKSWRRPDFVVKESAQAYSIAVTAYRDFDESSVIRTKVIPVASGTSGAVWGAFTWGDGTRYGGAAKGAVIEKGGSFGSARSLQLRIQGDASKAWGVDAIILKFIPRALR
jgi:hypothetical protein